MQPITVLTLALLAAAVVLTGCTAGKYNGDLALLQQHTDAFELTDQAGRGRVIVVPQYQGRVMTSTATGVEGMSLGWINPPAITAGVVEGPVNAYGGEERLWLGPEGGQFSIFFKKGVPFDLDHWKVPALIDTEPFDVVRSDKSSAVFGRDAKVTNTSGFTFEMRIDRTVTVLEPAAIAEKLKLPERAKLEMVGYETVNALTNKGDEAWTEKTGMLSIWLLGMFPATPKTTAVLPVVKGSEADLGPAVNVYESFASLGPDRLKAEAGVVYYKGDGKYRSKIGISPKRARPVLGSYDAVNEVLTIVEFNLPAGATQYVKSTWEHQKDPFGGDVTNSYNDGGGLGNFYELESSSPAAMLKPGQKITHTSRTYHLLGDKADLDKVARQVLGVSLAEIEAALP